MTQANRIAGPELRLAMDAAGARRRSVKLLDNVLAALLVILFVAVVTWLATLHLGLGGLRDEVDTIKASDAKWGERFDRLETKLDALIEAVAK